MSENIITLNSELIHPELKDLVRNSVEETLNSLLDAEADFMLKFVFSARSSCESHLLFHNQQNSICKKMSENPLLK